MTGTTRPGPVAMTILSFLLTVAAIAASAPPSLA